MTTGIRSNGCGLPRRAAASRVVGRVDWAAPELIQGILLTRFRRRKGENIFTPVPHRNFMLTPLWPDRIRGIDVDHKGNLLEPSKDDIIEDHHIYLLREAVELRWGVFAEEAA